MASSLTRGVKCVAKSSSSVSAGWEWLLVLRSSSNRFYAAAKAKASSSSSLNGATMRESSIPSSEKEEDLEDLVPTSGISRPLSEILKELNKKVPDSLIRVRTESDGFPVKYIPWHIVNRIMNLHAPEWSGEVRSIMYSADGKSVSVVYRVTLYGTDAEIYKESTGTAPVNDVGYGDPVQKAEAMAFRRAFEGILF
ncbi:DNA repair RAD52-like protein 1, mitochondrial [Camellia sinensis]|uniref:DNA repair RAD52-like protein 1, mitochondrial n=1 Tax=Camellia sinensis TaxID=4442 RepID=UPI001035AE3E|nr:DNA repair RAD52-like protein 1, mitochondrial [Camellia sinensis]